MTPEECCDRAEIHDVVIRYGWAIDTKDWDLLDTCFTPDAHLDYSSNPGGKAGAYPEIRAWLAEALSDGAADALALGLDPPPHAAKTSALVTATSAAAREVRPLTRAI